MDRQADVIRSEIDQTRAALEDKLSRLEARARELTPRRYARRFVRERVFEQIAGATLILAGGLMAWRRRPRRATHKLSRTS